MANEIVKMVAKQANLSEPIAQIAVDTVLNVLKSKLPSAVGSSLDAFLSSNSAASNSKKENNPLGDIANVAGSLGGLLGKKK